MVIAVAKKKQKKQKKNKNKKTTDNFVLITETFNTAINAHLKLLSSSVTCQLCYLSSYQEIKNEKMSS